MKISVIVPIYNVENYLEECLDSLLDQNLSETEYEIICVDDGSTDRSGEIAEEYGKKYGQIKVIRQENGGVSRARNQGLKIARGEYICFVDSDDYLSLKVLGRLYELAVQYNLDKLMYGFVRFEDEQQKHFYEKNAEEIGEGTLCFFNNALEMGDSHITPDWKVIWNYLIRRSILTKYQLQFFEGVYSFEDEEFDFWLSHCAGPSGYVNQDIYHYRQRGRSILRTFMDDGHFVRYIQGRCKLILYYRNVVENIIIGNFPEMRIPPEKEELENRLFCEIKGILSRLIYKGNTEIFESTLQFLKEEQLYPYPMRFYWQKKNHMIKRIWIMGVTFLYPIEWYLRFCMAIRCMVFKRVSNCMIGR